MAPYIGEIRMFAGNFAPAGWEFCSGQLIPISENETLFNLIGTTYGGDGQETFALPNLQSRVPVHMGTQAGNSYIIGQSAGVEQVTLTTQQIPSHSHVWLASDAAANAQGPNNKLFARPNPIDLYDVDNGPDGDASVQLIAPIGGSQPHDNMQPYLCISFIISMYGIYPSQT
jgi:microcystin-dependent protein